MKLANIHLFYVLMQYQINSVTVCCIKHLTAGNIQIQKPCTGSN